VTPAGSVTPSAARPAVLAIDGGNSKTDAILVSHDGSVLHIARGGGFQPQTEGLPAALSTLDEIVAALLPGRGGPAGPVVEHVSAYLAGADLPEEEVALQQALVARGWGASTRVGNDTFALLRAGATAGWGVAVVCGSGINCAGIGPDGRTIRFPALGRLTGDWGGGHFLGEESLWWAVRAEDGRGPLTSLASAVPAHFGLPTAGDVAVAMFTGRIHVSRLDELAPVLFAQADAGDQVAAGLVGRLAEEVAALGLTALRRLDLLGMPTEIVLGGGVLARRNPSLMHQIERRYAAGAPHASLRMLTAPPVLGAALLGLDHLGSPDGAEERLRAQFAAGGYEGARETSGGRPV
jgi:N-acetylglucosamine kinase-like BadF-type ATPase